VPDVRTLIATPRPVALVWGDDENLATVSGIRRIDGVVTR
jgi:hypothetical protein